MSQQLSTWSLLTATAGILAFLIGVYTMVGRDRKSPYLINSVFAIFVLALVGAAIDIAALLAATINQSAGEWLLRGGGAVLLLSVLITIQRLWTIYVRFAYFIDPAGLEQLRYLPVVRQYRAGRKKKKKLEVGQTYEHNPARLSPELQAKIKTIIKNAVSSSRKGESQSTPSTEVDSKGVLFEVRDRLDPRSLAMALRHQGQANELLSNICMAFLNCQDHCVQYMTASRHPIEFIDHLKQTMGENWQPASRRIVVVDAYTPHFGFLDSINGAKSDKIRDEFGDRLLASSETYAGLHSASSLAFNRIKRMSSNGSIRQPTLVIYEDMYALSDLESVEQYRIFARHVIPSERLWDGMFTIFAETVQREDDWKLISSYAGMILDLRANAAGKLPKAEMSQRTASS